jgi:hypothetical protein
MRSEQAVLPNPCLEEEEEEEEEFIFSAQCSKGDQIKKEQMMIRIACMVHTKL